MSLVRLIPRFRKAYAALTELANRETWSRAEIEAYQLERLNETWAHAVQHVSYYRRLTERENLPQRFANLQEFCATVPILPKSAVRADRMQFLSDMALPGRWKYTGGSTGIPTTFYRSNDAHLRMLRARYRFYQMWNVDIFDRWAYLWGHAASFAPGIKGLKDRLLTPVKDRLRNRIRLSAYDLGKEDLRRHLERIAAFKPAAIYTYSTAGYLLALEAEEIGFQCDSLKLVKLTSEPVHDYIADAAQRAFGVPAINEYGSIECGFIAGQWPDRTLRIREDEVLLETVARDDGRFDIIVTVLGNASFPLIRYQIDDVSDGPIVYPDRGFAILHNLAGRHIDLVLTRSGRKLHGIIFEDVLEKYSAFRRWRVHQDLSGNISVLIENVREVEQEVLTKITNKLEQLVEGYEVKIELIDELPTTPSGKHRAIISDLASHYVPNDSAVVETSV